LSVDYLILWTIAAAVLIIGATVVVVRNWRRYNLPIRLIPLDVLTLVLLVDLNIKSSSNLTVDDPVMRMEAIAFTGLLTFVLFAPVVWKAAFDRKKTRTKLAG
jgi:hypothetical protein